MSLAFCAPTNIHSSDSQCFTMLQATVAWGMRQHGYRRATLLPAPSSSSQEIYSFSFAEILVRYQFLGVSGRFHCPLVNTVVEWIPSSDYCVLGMHWLGCLMHWLAPVETQHVGVNGQIEFVSYRIVVGRQPNPLDCLEYLLYWVPLWDGG